MQKSNLFLKYSSKSEKAWYEFTDLYHLKPTDKEVMQYYMHMFQKSTSHGKKGKRGHCYYRNDRKLKGFFVTGKYKDMAKNIHAELKGSTVKASTHRLQVKYGLLYCHQSYNSVQIFFPIFDQTVRKSFNDPDYKTVINFKEIYKSKKHLSAKIKNHFPQRQKTLFRKAKKLLSSNVPKGNEPKSNAPKTNVVQHKHHQSTKSKASNKLPKWFSNKLTKQIGTALIKNHKDIKKWGTKIIDIIFKENRKYFNIRGTKYFKPESNPYIQDGNLYRDLGLVLALHYPLESTLEDSYENYIKEHSNLKMTHKSKANERFYSRLTKTTYVDNIDDARKDMAKYKGKNDSKYKEAKSSFNKWVRLGCKNTDLEPWAIKGTKEYKDTQHQDPTSKKQINKIDIQQAKYAIRDNNLDIDPRKFVTIKNSYLDEYKLEHKITNDNEYKYNGKAIKTTIKAIKYDSITQDEQPA